MLLEFSRGKSFVVAVFIVESFAKESSDGRGTSLHFCRPREIPWRNEREKERERERGRRGESRKTFFSASIINLLFVAFGREFRIKNKSVKGYLSLRSK